MNLDTDVIGAVFEFAGYGLALGIFAGSVGFLVGAVFSVVTKFFQYWR